MTGSWSGVLAGRLGDRFGKGIGAPPRDAMVADLAPRDLRPALARRAAARALVEPVVAEKRAPHPISPGKKPFLHELGTQAHVPRKKPRGPARSFKARAGPGRRR